MNRSVVFNKPGEGKKKEEKGGIFAGLNRRTSTLMHQLLRTKQDKTQGQADMRWERFVKVRLCVSEVVFGVVVLMMRGRCS